MAVELILKIVVAVLLFGEAGECREKETERGSQLN